MGALLIIFLALNVLCFVFVFRRATTLDAGILLKPKEVWSQLRNSSSSIFETVGKLAIVILVTLLVFCFSFLGPISEHVRIALAKVIARQAALVRKRSANIWEYVSSVVYIAEFLFVSLAAIAPALLFVSIIFEPIFFRDVMCSVVKWVNASGFVFHAVKYAVVFCVSVLCLLIGYCAVKYKRYEDWSFGYFTNGWVLVIAIANMVASNLVNERADFVKTVEECHCYLEFGMSDYQYDDSELRQLIAQVGLDASRFEMIRSADVDVSRIDFLSGGVVDIYVFEAWISDKHSLYLYATAELHHDGGKKPTVVVKFAFSDSPDALFRSHRGTLTDVQVEAFRGLIPKNFTDHYAVTYQSGRYGW